MRRPGALSALTHDLTHRGWSAYGLAAVLLGFYFGLYLPSEVRNVAASLSVLRLSLLSVTVGAVALGLHAWWRHEDEGTTVSAELRTLWKTTGLRVAALTAATVAWSSVFARVLDPPVHGGRHLLPAMGERWPWAVTATLLVGAGAWFSYGVGKAFKTRTIGPVMHVVLGAGVALLVLLYGTHAFDPTLVAPEGERSLRRLAHLVYFAFDSRWTLYGFLYTVAVSAGGFLMLGRYGHNRYQVIRTLVVMGVQVSFGFSVPLILKLFAWPEAYLSYFWPLKIDALYPDNLLRNPLPLIAWALVGALVLVPLLGLVFGKRWYCSWVCGCGGLANTAGEPFRQLSSKSDRAWRFERKAIYTVLVLSIAVTALVVLASFIGPDTRPTGVYWGGTGAPGRYLFDPIRSEAIVGWAAKARYYYGLIITAVLSGAIGVGLYPLGGTRQWCRNFCPMAAMLGLVQKASRFRVAVKKGMCISCGLCSNACEMGIDVRAYAQRDESFTRASCVGCGLCSEVCPRGVLSLTQEKAPVLVQIRRKP